MTKFEGSELRRVVPTLREGKKEIIPQFYDESCLMVNNYKAKTWLGPGQMILQKKGCGCNRNTPVLLALREWWQHKLEVGVDSGENANLRHCTLQINLATHDCIY